MNIITITFDEFGKYTLDQPIRMQQGDHLTNQLKMLFHSSWGTITQVQVHALLPDEVTVTPNTVLTISSVGGDYWTYDVPSWFTVYSGQLKLAISCSYALVGEETPKRFSRVIPLQIDESVISDGSFSIDPIVEESILVSIADLTARLIVVENAYVSKTVTETQTILSTLALPQIDLDGHTIDWNATDGTFDMEMLNGAVLQVGQEFYIYGKATELINEGAVVQFAGAQGGHILLKNAVASEINANPQYLLGVATTAFSGNGVFGYVTILGKVRALDTSAYAEGTVLWFDSTNGGLTNVAPTAPKAKIRVCAVLYQHATQGSIMVRPTFAIKLSSLQDVYVNGESDGNVFVYDSANGYWKGSTRLTDLEEQVLSIGGVENSAVDKVNDLLLDYPDNVTIQGASVDITSDTTAVNVSSYTNINLASQGSTDIGAQQGVNISAGLGNMYISTGAGLIDVSATGNIALNSNDEMDLYALNGINLYSDGNITLGGLEIQVNGTLQVNGDIIQNGSTYETHAEQIYTEKDHIILRDGAIAGLSAGTYAGLITKLADGVNDAFFGYNGDGIARVGDITYVGDVPDFSSTQALATRQDSPIANGVAYWNDTNKRLDTNSTVLINPALTTNVPLTINALSGQTANLSQWNVNGVQKAAIYNDGRAAFDQQVFTTGVYNKASGSNANILVNDTGTVISRNIADSNPAFKVNLANAGATGSIAEFQKAGSTLAGIDNSGRYTSNFGIANRADYSNSSVYTFATGTVITRNINDANPALTVNEQQGTGDILRLQFGGATKSVFNKDGWLGMVGITTPLYSIHTGGNIAIQNTEPELHFIDTNNDSDYYIANSNGTFQIYDSTNDSARLSISSAGKTTISDLQVNTGGTLLATNNANGAYTVSALSNYKFVEVRATLDGYRWCSSGKIPVGKFVYDSGTPANSTGLSMIVTGKPSGVYGTPATFTLYPANSGLTSLTVDADMSNYDITFEIIGWTY